MNIVTGNKIMDYSTLKPATYVTGFDKTIKVYEEGTEEVRSYLANECDILYECKVCRNLFRGVTEFIFHKRMFCKQQFSTLKHWNLNNVEFCDTDPTIIKQIEDGTKNNKLTLTQHHDRAKNKVVIPLRSTRAKRVTIKRMTPHREAIRLQTDKEREEANCKDWLDNIEIPENTHICMYCFKLFKRRAILTSHLKICSIKHNNDNQRNNNIKKKNNNKNNRQVSNLNMLNKNTTNYNNQHMDNNNSSLSSTTSTLSSTNIEGGNTVNITNNYNNGNNNRLNKRKPKIVTKTIMVDGLGYDSIEDDWNNGNVEHTTNKKLKISNIDSNKLALEQNMSKIVMKQNVRNDKTDVNIYKFKLDVNDKTDTTDSVPIIKNKLSILDDKNNNNKKKKKDGNDKTDTTDSVPIIKNKLSILDDKNNNNKKKKNMNKKKGNHNYNPSFIITKSIKKRKTCDVEKNLKYNKTLEKFKTTTISEVTIKSENNQKNESPQASACISTSVRTTNVNMTSMAMTANVSKSTLIHENQYEIEGAKLLPTSKTSTESTLSLASLTTSSSTALVASSTPLSFESPVLPLKTLDSVTFEKIPTIIIQKTKIVHAMSNNSINSYVIKTNNNNTNNIDNINILNNNNTTNNMNINLIESKPFRDRRKPIYKDDNDSYKENGGIVPLALKTHKRRSTIQQHQPTSYSVSTLSANSSPLQKS